EAEGMLGEKVLEQTEAKCAKESVFAAGVDGDEDGGGEDEIGGGLSPAKISGQRHLNDDGQVGEDEIADPAHTSCRLSRRILESIWFCRAVRVEVVVLRLAFAARRRVWIAREALAGR